MTMVLGIVGSLRTASTNMALMRTAAERAPDGLTITVGDIGDLPLFDQDLEIHGFPEPVRRLREEAAAADGFLFAFPEYNWSVPGVLKNAFDWLSRRPQPPVDDKPAAFMSAAGRGGGRRAQAHMTDVVAHNRLRLAGRSLQVPRSHEHVEDGRLTTPELLRQMDLLLGELNEMVVAKADTARLAG